jgi:CBS domain-containing protein
MESPFRRGLILAATERGKRNSAEEMTLMSTVADILVHKKADVITILSDETVFEAISVMVNRNVGSIVVTDEDNSILGIFTERDYLRRTVLENLSPKTTIIRDVMSRNVISVDPNRSVDQCLAIMTNEHIRHIPVIENGRLAGIVSMGDLVKHLYLERGFEIKSLTDYITGRYPGEVGAGAW